MYKPRSLELVNIGTHKHTTYTFRQGQPTLVVGENLDDSAQPRNGSGKSLIVEGVAIAVTGDVIRASSLKEIVRREADEDSGYVELVLENAMFGSVLRIKRTIYRTKAQVVELYEDGKQKVYADVNEYNKAILEYLDISKEDFFAFYLITSTAYVPFLRVGDVKKKEIINRFSGADDVDNVIPKIDEDVNEKNSLIDALFTQIASNQGKQEVLADQITAEENKYSDESKALLKADQEEELNILLETIVDAQVEFDHKKDTLADTEAAKFIYVPINYDHRIAETQIIKQGYDKQIKDLTIAFKEAGKGVKYIKDLEAIEAGERKLTCSLENQRKEIKEANEIRANVETKLAGEIICPECDHHFLLVDKDYNIEEGKGAITELEQIIKDGNEQIQQIYETVDVYSHQRQDLKDKVIKDQEEIKKQLANLNANLFNTEADLRLLHADKTTQEKFITGLEEAICVAKKNTTLQEELINDLIKKAEQQDAAIKDIDNLQSKSLEEFQNRLMEYMDQGVELHEKLAVQQEELQKIEEWYTNFKNFKSYLANQSIKNIEDYTNLYLNQMSSNLSIKIEGYKVQSNKKIAEKITTTVLRNGFESASYGTFSAGERARIDIACILAIQTLINLNCKSGGLDMCMCDEILDSVDAVGIESIVAALENTHRTVLIISQQEINSNQEHVLKVRKQNKISTIV